MSEQKQTEKLTPDYEASKMASGGVSDVPITDGAGMQKRQKELGAADAGTAQMQARQGNILASLNKTDAYDDEVIRRASEDEQHHAEANRQIGMNEQDVLKYKTEQFSFVEDNGNKSQDMFSQTPGKLEPVVLSEVAMESSPIGKQPMSINDLFTLLSQQFQTQTSVLGTQINKQSSQLATMDSNIRKQGETLGLKIDTVDKKVEDLGNTVTEVKKEINRINAKAASMQGQINEINDRFDAEVINIQNSVEPIVNVKIDEKVFGLKSEIMEECDSKIADVKSNVTKHDKQCEQTVSQVHNRIVNLEKRVQSSPKVSSIIIDRVNISKLLEGEEKFDPARKHKGWHPLDFLKNCERLFTPDLTDLEKINLVIHALAGDAKRWGLSLEINNISFDEFKTRFREEYWSERQQDSLWREFVMARMHDNKNKGSLKDYCESWYRRLAHLRDRRSDSEIIWELWKKLPEDSKRYVGSCHRKFSAFLEKVQDEDHWRSGRDYRQPRREQYDDRNEHERAENEERVRVNSLQRGRGRGRGRGAGRGRHYYANEASDYHQSEN